MAEASPEWKKPSDIMKLRRRKTMGADLTNKTRAARSSPRLSLDGSTTPERKSVKRKNPFARSPSAMADTSEERICSSLPSAMLMPTTESLPSDSSVVLDGEDARQKWRQDCLRKALDSDFSGYEPARVLSSHPSVDAGVNLQNFETVTDMSPVVPDTAAIIPMIVSPQKSSSVVGSRTFPRDWSLKTKVRFISMSSFSWCTSLRGVDESHGTRAFVTAARSPCTVEQNACAPSVDDIASRQQEFQQQLMYWIHPNVPWLQTFPRITSSVRQFVSPSSNLMQNEEVTKGLYNDWCDSMNSAYLMVRSGLCPYLYVCCHQMTILFRAAGVVREQLHAIMTPTTRGLRAALDSEGIEYSLPVKRQHSVYKLASQSTATDTSPSQQQSRCSPAAAADGDDEDDEDENNADDSAASVWLRDLGLDQKRYRSVDPSKVRDQKDKFRQIDYRPESTVLVEGTAGTQALLNYLLDCSSCFAATGPQAGLPPTMLAPTAFKGATLQSLKVRLGSVLTQSATDSHRQAASSVELSGPLLPHSIAGLGRLFARTSSDRFTTTFAVHEPTTSFNAADDDQSKTSTSVSDADSHEVSTPMPAANPLSETATMFLASDVVHDSSSELGRGAVREITCENGFFTWTCY